MEKYTVTGMSCAACVARVERAVKGVKGVESCQVNLLTSSMNVSGLIIMRIIFLILLKFGKVDLLFMEE